MTTPTAGIIVHGMGLTARTKLMDGRLFARRLAERVMRDVATMRSRTGVDPALVTVSVGADPGAVAYARVRTKRCAEVGIVCRESRLPAPATTEQLVSLVRALACDATVHAILVQHPIPIPIDKRAAFEAIPLEKDVDGVSSAALGRVILGLPAFSSCTPAGIMRLLAEYRVPLDGAHAVVIGRSPILGRPMASMLINAHATVTLCHSHSRDLPGIVRAADLVIAAMGKARYVQGDWIKPGAVVVDAGYNEGNVGDVDFEAAVERASLITPVPGGVGPMTIAMLLEHTVRAAARQLGVTLNASDGLS